MRSVHIHDISRYELPGLSRNYNPTSSTSSNEKNKKLINYEKSKNYGNYALKLFQAQNNKVKSEKGFKKAPGHVNLKVESAYNEKDSPDYRRV